MRIPRRNNNTKGMNLKRCLMKGKEGNGWKIAHQKLDFECLSQEIPWLHFLSFNQACKTLKVRLDLVDCISSFSFDVKFSCRSVSSMVGFPLIRFFHQCVMLFRSVVKKKKKNEMNFRKKHLANLKQFLFVLKGSKSTYKKGNPDMLT